MQNSYNEEKIYEELQQLKKQKTGNKFKNKVH